jgi:hypothetical protein
VGGSDDGCVDSAENAECLVERCRHAREQVSELFWRRLEEVADVAADGERGTIATDENGAHGCVGGDPARDDQRLLSHPQVDGVPLVRPVQTHGRDAVGHRVVDGLEGDVGTECVDPGGGVGELAQRGYAAVLIEPQHVGELRVECPSRSASRSSVVPRHQEVAVVEDPKFVGLRLHREVLADLPPQVALHGLGTAMLAAHAQRKALSSMADEVVAQQRVDRGPVAARQRPVERKGRRDGASAGFDAHIRPRT